MQITAKKADYRTSRACSYCCLVTEPVSYRAYNQIRFEQSKFPEMITHARAI